MTKVFIHGVPETAAIWKPLLGELIALGHHDVVCLSPPGFGTPLPDEFGASVEEYRDWLVNELSKFDTPVHLVGHDWGGGHVVGVAMSRPDLLLSWVTDIIGAFEPGYVWHEAAQIWQRAGDGERHLEQLFSGSASDKATRMREFGIPGPASDEVSAAQGPEMARAILALYRSAAQPALVHIGGNLVAASARPGMAIIATEDQAVGSFEARLRGAERAGARAEVLEGLGHWWMLEDPVRAAQVLITFWNAP
jgi:pimeloyl-ACP methyl ester carboxylesterase